MKSRGLALDEELRRITQLVRLLDNRDNIQIVSAWAVRPDDLLQQLNEHRPHVVHFSGHGSASGELVLSDSHGLAQTVSPEALKALFSNVKDNIRVVVLNACYSEIQACAISEVIDYVVGMATSVADSTAAIFAGAFYRALGFDRTVTEAFEQARTALLLEGDSAGAIVPKLLVRQDASTGEGVLQSSSSESTETFGWVVRQWKRVLERPAFQISCIEELFLRELSAAIDDTQAALNTGRLYSRSGNLLAELPMSGAPETELRSFLSDMTKQLIRLKRLTADFEQEFARLNPDYSHHQNFFAMQSSLRSSPSAKRRLLMRMNQIDELRNQILLGFNALLWVVNESPFPLIKLSSRLADAHGW